MGTNQSWGAVGEEVRTAIQDALKTGDFKNFNEIVAGVATEAVKAAKEQLNQSASARSPQTGQTAGGQVWENHTEKWIREHSERRQEHQNRLMQSQPIRANLAPFESKGSVAGTLLQVFGGIGTGIMALVTSLFTLLGLSLGGGFWVAVGVSAAILSMTVGMIKGGGRLKARLKRARRYLELAGNNHYINLEDLALHTNQSKKAVLKDVKEMLADGFFPQGHLDRQKSCLMLDNRIYDEYLALEKQRRAQTQEPYPAPERQETVQQNAGASVPPEVGSLIAEGQACIRKLRDLNDNIPGEVISAKLFRLENLLKEIFDRVREHPEQASQMQKFMDYYLPTTLKLVTAYEEFDSLSEQGTDITEAKAEIEKTLDTINSAFSELLNRLFREAAYDVTTDAQVLQTMLAKEGLTKEPELMRR